MFKCFHFNNNNNLSNATIGEEDLADVQVETFEAAANWNAIGIGLGLQAGILEQIKGEGGCPKDCMIAVLTNWLRKNYKVERFGEPTWKTVVKVVASPAAGSNPALALRIAEKHPGNFDINFAHTLGVLHNCTHHSPPVYCVWVVL